MIAGFLLGKILEESSAWSLKHLKKKKYISIEGKGRAWRRRKIKIYYIPAQIPYGEGDHCIYLRCANKINFF